MSDTATQGISVNPDALRSKLDEILVLDQVIDAAGSADSGKIAIANELASTHENFWSKPVKSVVDNFSKIEDVEQLTAAVTALRKAVNDNFNKKVDEFLTAQVEARKSNAPEVSDEEVEKALTQRRELVKQYRALREILDMFGMDISSIPEPKKMTGSRGKRGPRVLQGYIFSVDGKERSASTNNLSSIANTVCPDGWKVAELREFLSSKGLDLENPPAEWKYELPNGKVLSAVKGAVENDGEESEDENSEGETE